MGRQLANPRLPKKMAKRMAYSVIGLPHYTIWHMYEPSVDDIRHMEELEAEKKKKEAAEAAKEARRKETEAKIKDEFGDMSEQSREDRVAVARVQRAREREYEQLARDKERAVLRGEGADE